MNFGIILQVLGAGWIGTLLGVAGIIAGYVLYRRARVGGALAYQTQGSRLIGFAELRYSEDIAVQYKGQPVPRITSSEVVLWNAGNATIQQVEVAARDPIRISIPDGERILDFAITRTTRSVCGATVDRTQENELLLTFDFLGVADGVRVALLHTSADRHPLVTGTLSTSTRGLRDWGLIRDTKWSAKTRTIGPPTWLFAGRVPRLAYIVSTLGLAFLVAARVVARSTSGREAEGIAWLAVANGIVYLGIGAFVFSVGRHRLPVSLDTDDKNDASGEPPAWNTGDR